MEHPVPATPALPDARVAVPVVSLRELAPWTLFAVVLMSLAYVVAMAPDHLVHELLHDGRHLLGFPCH
jgi:cobalt transporter subunit CbtB